jgi:hypothetical protein
MKVCPTCSEVYKDDDINFCLADGTTLLKKKNGKAPKHSLWNDVVAIILAAVAVLDGDIDEFIQEFLIFKKGAAAAR